MTELLPEMEGEARDPERSQWFTPPQLAERVAYWALRPTPGLKLKVLEPSAGNGALLWPALRTGMVSRATAFEVDPLRVEALSRPPLCDRDSIRCEDFLAAQLSGERWDLALCNTPFEDGQDVAFAEKCLRHCTRVVGIYPARMLHSQARAEFWSKTQIMRMAVLSWRPSFGGGTGKTDFLVMELTYGSVPHGPTEIEWWSR